jgi:hypothetical protein
MDDTNKICIKQLKGSNSDPDRLDMKELTKLFNRLETQKEKDRLIDWMASVELLREYAKENDLALSIDIAGGI